MDSHPLSRLLFALPFAVVAFIEHAQGQPWEEWLWLVPALFTMAALGTFMTGYIDAAKPTDAVAAIMQLARGFVSLVHFSLILWAIWSAYLA